MSSALTSNPTPAPSPAAASASASGGHPTQPTFHGMPVANVDPTGNLNIDASSVNAKHSDLVRQHVMAAVAEERAEIETRLKTQQDTRFQEIQRMFEALKQAQRQSEMDEANKKVCVFVFFSARLSRVCGLSRCGSVCRVVTGLRVWSMRVCVSGRCGSVCVVDEGLVDEGLCVWSMRVCVRG